MGKRLILVTGATGYIASRLIPRLLDAGHRVRALARNPRQLDGRGWSGLVDIFPADVMDAASLAPALEGVHTAYYLIHNMSSGRGYTERELDGARNFASACEAAGVKHIIYLGGLADPEQHIAPHMRSRIETGRVLREGRVPVTEFRAGVIAGEGSISFEMIRFTTELFPIVPGPTWLNNRSQPIAIQNVIDYLMAALDNWDGHGQVFEIGGPQIFHYKDLMLQYAQVRGLKRMMILLPYIPLWFMAWGVGLMTPVPRRIAHALIGGLSADSVVQHPEARTVFPEVKLIGFPEAAHDALARLHPAHVERVWKSSDRPSSLKHEGFFVLHHAVPMTDDFQNDFQLKNWQVESREPQRILFHRSRPFGEEWIEQRVESIPSSLRDGVLLSKQSPRSQGLLRSARNDGHTHYLIQTYFFAPRGLLGFLYWYVSYPFRIISFRGLIRRVQRIK
ncbi:MAG: NAD-dependent epimerase/dehydratase family protein [Anaerolineaceae bacterium]|nr:MAG: NAD-dependent epimerase/dehydratase family protein [Anaerolineaceae bacterium]